MEKPRVKWVFQEDRRGDALPGDKLNALDRAMFDAIDETLNALSRQKGCGP